MVCQTIFLISASECQKVGIAIFYSFKDSRRSLERLKESGEIANGFKSNCSVHVNTLAHTKDMSRDKNKILQRATTVLQNT